jgi:hypothetical protein
MLPLSLDTLTSDLHPLWFPLPFFLLLFFDGSHFIGFPALKKKCNAILFYPLFWLAPLDWKGWGSLSFLHHCFEGGLKEYESVLLPPLLPHQGKWKMFVGTTARCRNNALQRETMVVFKPAKRWQLKLWTKKCCERYLDSRMYCCLSRHAIQAFRLCLLLIDINCLPWKQITRWYFSGFLLAWGLV